MANHIAECKGKCSTCQDRSLACEKNSDHIACQPCLDAKMRDCIFAMDSWERVAANGIGLHVEKAVKDLNEMRVGGVGEGE